MESQKYQLSRGILPVVQMPYHEDFMIDFDCLEAEVNYAFACGANGIVFALASELLRLTNEERREVASFLVRTSSNRGSVVISVGAESTFAAVEYARHAASIGATALMAIPPLSASLDDKELRSYYEAILAASPLPLIVQDASSYVGKPMSAAFQSSLFTEHTGRVGFKPEASPVGPVISEINAATQNSAAIYEGSGGTMLVENYRRGIAGTMPGTDLLEAIVALWHALEAGDSERIYGLSPLIGSILALAVGLDGYLAVEKHLMVRHGIFRNTLVRGPVGFRLDEAATLELDRLYDRLQVVLRQ